MSNTKDMAGRIFRALGLDECREEGQAMIEYGMLVGLVSVVSIFILTLIGTSLGHVFHTAFAAM